MEEVCELCLREGLRLTRHHLIPRREHRRVRVERETSRVEREKGVILICRDCHNQLHASLTLQEMAADYYTLETLLTHPDVARYVTWIRQRKPQGTVRVRRR